MLRRMYLGGPVKLITRDTDYAIRAVCFIAKGRKDMACVKDLVRRLRIPRPFLRKILQKLNKNRLLKSYRGKGGGFALSESAEKISVYDMIKIFQGDIKLSEHTFKKRPCPEIKRCYLKAELDKIEARVTDDLKSIMLSSLIRD